MRAKIALIVALASFLALSALGVGMAGADPLRRKRAGRHRPATTTTAVPSLQAPACANGVDDDGDGLVDMADPDCTSPTDTSEAPEPLRSGASPASPTPAAEARHRRRQRRPGRRHDRRQPRRRERRSGGGVTHNESLGDSSGGGSANGGGQRPQRDRRRRPAAGRRRRRRLPVRRRRRPHPRQPDDDDRALRAGPDRRPQLRHRLLRDPALPAADLPGLRNRIRDPLGGARLDQQNRDRLRHQPQRLQRRRRRLDAVPALELGNVRRSTPTATGAKTPTTRSTRSAPPPTTSRSPAAARTSTTRSSPTTTPTGTRRRCCSTPAPTASCRPTWSAR